MSDQAVGNWPARSARQAVLLHCPPLCWRFPPLPRWVKFCYPPSWARCLGLWGAPVLPKTAHTDAIPLILRPRWPRGSSILISIHQLFSSYFLPILTESTWVGTRQPAMVVLPQWTLSVLRGIVERLRVIQGGSYRAERGLQGWWPSLAFWSSRSHPALGTVWRQQAGYMAAASEGPGCLLSAVKRRHLHHMALRDGCARSLLAGLFEMLQKIV